MARPGPYDLVVTKGGTLREVFRWVRRTPPSRTTTPVPLAGGSARAQFIVRSAAVLTFDAGGGEDGQITLSDDGTIEMHASAEIVAALRAGEGDWSLEVQPPGEDRRVLLAGRVTIVGETTL